MCRGLKQSVAQEPEKTVRYAPLATSSPDHPAPERSLVDSCREICLKTFRFALLVTGSREAAQAAMQEVFVTLSDPVSRSKGSDRLRMLLIRQVRRHLEKSTRFRVAPAKMASDTPAAAPGLPARVAALREPDRSAFAMFLCSDSQPERLAEFLGLRVSKFGAAVLRARRALDPAGDFPDCPHLGLFRSWKENTGRVAKAAAAEKTPELQAQFAAQTAFDDRVYAEVASITAPEMVLAPMPAAATGSGWGTFLRQPALLAIAVAGLVVLGVAVFAARRKLDDFTGKEFVCELIADADEMSGMEMEQIKPMEAGKLGDWFMLKGFDGFAAPPELAGFKALGCRVYEHEGHSIAQVALDRHNALLFVFHNASKRVRLKTLTWRVFQEDEWAVAARGDGIHCFVVAFLGDSKEMLPLLNESPAAK